MKASWAPPRVEFLASLAGDVTASRRDRLATAMQGLHERGEQLLTQLWHGLAEIEAVTLYGPPPGTARTPTLSFRVHGQASESVARYLAPRGVYVSHGDFYATTVARRLGFAQDGFVRAGCSCYTTAAEVARLVDGVRALASGR